MPHTDFDKNLNFAEKVVTMFNEFSLGNKSCINDVYFEQVVFQDPIKTILGRNNLIHYLDGLYANVSRCEFKLRHYHSDQIEMNKFHNLMNNTLKKNTSELYNLSADNFKECSLFWTMDVSHKRINQGKTISLDGMSYIIYHNKVIYHRDYYDVGQLVYENLPLFGNMIRWIKNQI